MIRPVSHIAEMAPYALAQLAAPDGTPLVSLSQNESHCPPSPRAIAAGAEAMASTALYPDPDWVALRSVLAQVHGIAAEGILCANGSMELIAALVRAYVDGTGAVLAPAHSYPFFRTAAQLVHARYDTSTPSRASDWVDGMLRAVRPNTRIVLVANPGNPTGTRVSRETLVALLDQLRPGILLVLDEAYGEFADHMNEPMFDLVARGDTVVLRTLSKAYGLAGLRVGWGLFPPDIAATLRKVLTPNSVSGVAQAAAAAALTDQVYMRATCAEVAERRDRFIARMRVAGLDVEDSFTNFALIRFATPQDAGQADAMLKSEGLILRAQGGAGLPACLRITVGRANDMDKAAKLLERWTIRRGT